MENTIQWLQVSGLLITLIVATIIFVRGITLLVRGRHHLVRFGLELLLFFAALYLVTEPILGALKLQAFAEPITRASAFFWWISLAFTVNASLNRFVWTGVLSDNGVRRIPKLLTDAIGLMVFASALMIVMHYVYKEPITAILASSGAIAFVIGLAAQPTVREIFAGLSLSTTKALRMGDFVEIDGVYGQVYEINWRSVSLKSPNTGSLHIFPNSSAAEKTILNFSEPTGLFKYWVVFYVEYSASPELVISTIAEELENTQYICRDPKPDFNILGFTSKGLEIRLRFYFKGDDPWWPAQNEACMAIWSSLRRKGIRLSIERFKLGSGDEFDLSPWTSEQVALPDEQCADLLSRHPVLKTLSPKVFSGLTETARRLDYTPPDCVYQEDDAGKHLYYVLEGAFSAYQVLPDGSEARIACFKAGDIVGLESLKPNSRLPHKLQADCYSVVYRLEASTVADLVAGNDEADTNLATYLDAQQKIIDQNLALHSASRKKAHHMAHRTELNLHLREHAEDLFAKPLLHKIAHLVKPRSMEQDLLKAMMSACALIASSRGKIDDVEKDFLRRNLGSIELFRHVEIDQSLALFEEYASKLSSAGSDGRHELMLKLEAISSEPRLCQLVMGIAHGMTSAHEEVLPAEQAQLETIAAVLRMPADIEKLVAEVKQSK